MVAQGIHAMGFKHAYWISHITFKSANTLALCQSKATLPKEHSEKNESEIYPVLKPYLPTVPT